MDERRISLTEMLSADSSQIDGTYAAFLKLRSYVRKVRTACGSGRVLAATTRPLPQAVLTRSLNCVTPKVKETKGYAKSCLFT